MLLLEVWSRNVLFVVGVHARLWFDRRWRGVWSVALGLDGVGPIWLRRRARIYHRDATPSERGSVDEARDPRSLNATGPNPQRDSTPSAPMVRGVGCWCERGFFTKRWMAS